MTAQALAEVPIKRAAIAAAKRTIAVCDGSKFGRTGLAHVCPVSELDAVITDTTALREAIEQIEVAGVAVRIL